MSFFPRRQSRRRRGSMRPIIVSIKNDVDIISAVAASTNLQLDLAIADDVHATATRTSVVNGCQLKAIWIEFWYYGLSAGETNDIFDAYLMKNPGNNLTPPNPGTIGSSNEKKFIIRSWRGLAGLKSLGGYPYRQQGRWFKIPRRYQRIGTDDRWQFVIRSPTTGNICFKAIYKWSQ